MSRSEPLKRKNYEQNLSAANICLSDDDEDVDIWHLVVYAGTNQFSVVRDDKIIIDKHDRKKGFVKDRNRQYECTILKSGSADYVNHKAERYERLESIETTSDERPTQKFKKIKNSGKHF